MPIVLIFLLAHLLLDGGGRSCSSKLWTYAE